MSNTKFTKGEWVVHDNGHYFDVGVFDSEIEAVLDRACIGVPHSDIANAHLIASAPKLYEALLLISTGQGLRPGDSIDDLLAEARGEK